MDIKVASERLRALASDDKKRSKAAQLRDVMDDIEAALAAGISRADVVAELAALGLEMSMATFETTLKRLRHKREKTWSMRALPTGRVVVHSRPQQGAPSTAGVSAHSTASVSGSHNPADLNKIMGDKPDLNALAKLAKRNKN